MRERGQGRGDAAIWQTYQTGLLVATGGPPEWRDRWRCPRTACRSPAIRRGDAVPAATAAVRKDAGDDPDVTDGLEIVATVSWNDGSEVTFSAGEGVGTVTKPGLQVPPGQPAINPVPRRMIVAAVRQVTPRGLHVEIAIPGGRQIAARTFNPRLGIADGLSILGTTGIVRPYCTRALHDALRCAPGRGRRVWRDGPRVGPRGDRRPRGPGEVRPRRSAAHRGRQRLGLRARPAAASSLAGLDAGGPPGQTGQAGGRPVGHALVAVRSGDGFLGRACVSM